jgi:hypothetical protein
LLEKRAVGEKADFRALDARTSAHSYSSPAVIGERKQRVLFLFPPSRGGNEIVMFRPCTAQSQEAILNLLDEPPVWAFLKEMGVRLEGLSSEFLQAD